MRDVGKGFNIIDQRWIAPKPVFSGIKGTRAWGFGLALNGSN